MAGVLPATPYWPKMSTPRPPAAPLRPSSDGTPRRERVAAAAPPDGGRVFGWLSLVLGLGGLVLAVPLPPAGIAAGVAGLVLGMLARIRIRTVVGMAGVVVSALTLVLGVLFLVVGLAVEHGAGLV